MALFRFRKVFPKDRFSSTVQRDLSMYTRIGEIATVDAEAGTCTIKWLDRPGFRFNVIITQASPGDWTIPVKGSVVLVSFDSNERARITRYINMGQKVRVSQTNTLPKLKEGDRFWEGGNGSFIYMKQNGDIVFSTADQGSITLENSTGNLKQEIVNWNIVTDAGTQYLGTLKRFVQNVDGTNSVTSILDPLNLANPGIPLTEFRFKMVENINGALALQTISTPLVDIMFGTYTTDAGAIPMVNGAPAVQYAKEILMRVTMQNGISICIDKEGVATISGMKRLNYNGASVDKTDPDTALGLVVNDPTKGNRGQHSAREHDTVTVPLTTGYVDPDHLSLNDAAAANVKALQFLAQSFISPAGPCTFNPVLIPPESSSNLQAIITSGADNLYVGDK